MYMDVPNAMSDALILTNRSGLSHFACGYSEDGFFVRYRPNRLFSVVDEGSSILLHFIYCDVKPKP